MKIRICKIFKLAREKLDEKKSKENQRKRPKSCRKNKKIFKTPLRLKKLGEKWKMMKKSLKTHEKPIKLKKYIEK